MFTFVGNVQLKCYHRPISYQKLTVTLTEISCRPSETEIDVDNLKRFDCTGLSMQKKVLWLLSNPFHIN